MQEVPNYDNIIDDLVNAGAFTESDDRELHLTREFRNSRSEFRKSMSELDRKEYKEKVCEYTSDTELSSDDINREIFGDAIAVHQICEDLDQMASLHAAIALDRMSSSHPDSGVPEGFIPVSVDEIESLIEDPSLTILYFWRQNCDPCDFVSEQLEFLLNEGIVPQDVTVGAVYGPSDPQTLREEYSVKIAPTILLCGNGSIEERLVGVIDENRLRREITEMYEYLTV